MESEPMPSDKNTTRTTGADMSLAAQWLGRHAPSAGPQLDPGQGAGSHTSQLRVRASQLKDPTCPNSGLGQPKEVTKY